MSEVWLYAIGSALVVSGISLIAVFTLALNSQNVKRSLMFLVSMSTGALLGGAFLHLLPEAVEMFGFTVDISLSLLAGFMVLFVLEKFISWRHCHIPTSEDHPHPFAYMNLVGDGLHNLIDGLVIGAAYLLSIPVGLATPLAVIMHEIPQEVGDFGVLVFGGYSRKRALMFNFLTAITSVVGVITALLLSGYIANISYYLVPFAAGGFLYIAGSDLIPELKKNVKATSALTQLLGIGIGIGIMLLLVLM
jgi:zinc and cadmium transporter